MHITLTGNLGSGKSTICNIMENKYGFEIYSTGKVQRKLAEEMGISVLEMNQLMCTNHKYDKMIDDATARISRENKDKDIVFDSRLAWNFVEESFKVFLSVSLDVAAERVLNDNRGNVESYTSLEHAREQLRLRAETENIRYKDIYNIEYFDFNNYNLVLDSTYNTPELFAKVIIDEARKGGEHKLLMSPERLSSIRFQERTVKNAFYPEETADIILIEDEYNAADKKSFDIIKKAAADGFSFVKAILL